ncbi:MAG: NUDIX hydrolase [Deltaproteobacteria bacterium]|nr:NUDIX hydrolase [Deltaproteobacteria bacterium]
MPEPLTCPHCGQIVSLYRNPIPTVDVIIETEADGRRGIVLIERKNIPLGWAIPGGYLDYGETAETAAVREAREETGLEVELTGLLGVYSAPDRDPRHHTITTVFMAEAKGQPQGHDDAARAEIFSFDRLPSPLAFDHARILDDYFAYQADRKGRPAVR